MTKYKLNKIYLTAAIIVLSLFQFIEVYPNTNNDSKGVINILSYYKVNKSGESIYVQNISKGFIYSSDYFVVTTFSNIKGAEMVYADTGITGNTGLVKLYPSEDISKTYYFQDEQRDIVVFKLNNFKSNDYISPGDKLPVIGEYLYTQYDNTNKLKGTVTNIIDVIKSQWIVLKLDADYNLLPGCPVVNKNGKCTGMVLYTEQSSQNIYILSFDQIDNTALTLSSNFGTVKFKPQIDDYMLSPSVFTKSKECTNEEIIKLKN